MLSLSVMLPAFGRHYAASLWQCNLPDGGFIYSHSQQMGLRAGAVSSVDRLHWWEWDNWSLTNEGTTSIYIYIHSIDVQVHTYVLVVNLPLGLSQISLTTRVAKMWNMCVLMANQECLHSATVISELHFN